MFDAIFNNLIILIPVAVFIGRIIVAAGKKRSPPPRIPVHFEDEPDEAKPAAKVPPRATIPEAGEYFRSLGGTAPAKESPRLAPLRPKTTGKPKRQISSRAQGELAPFVTATEKTASGAKAAQTAPVSAGSAASPAQKAFALNLARLSPLKQAVVMAEVLGPPKALL